MDTILVINAGSSSIKFQLFAIRGQGTTCNDRPVRATAGTELDFSRMAGPKPLVQRLSGSPDEITLHPRIGSLALRLCRVADGNLDAAFCRRPEPRLGSCRGEFDRTRSEW